MLSGISVRGAALGRTTVGLGMDRVRNLDIDLEVVIGLWSARAAAGRDRAEATDPAIVEPIASLW
ncbi:hypothetical protein BCD49_26980 [Pseudofrankia sp. EUN1h]|nr:hypothetical protein BCD49_26980 [Pseudofrankia sp. EUN1h]